MAQARLAVVLLGGEVNGTLPALPPPRRPRLPTSAQTRPVIRLNTSAHVSAFDPWFDYGCHGRQIDQQILTLLTAVTKETKEITV